MDAGEDNANQLTVFRHYDKIRILDDITLISLYLGVAQFGQRACFGNKKSEVQILPPRLCFLDFRKN